MKQNRNFNFQGVSSTNEKMLIILSWIIVVIIVVLIGLYYGQQAREQAVSTVKVDSKNSNQNEVSADSNSRIEENEMKVAKESTSVLTDSLALNKNEVFTVQIGSAVDGEYYDENQIGEIEKEFSAKNLYTQRVIVNPDKKQFVLQVGIFKAYEEAKTLLNNVKLKNYPAQIETIIDPKTEVAFIPKPAEPKSSNEITVASADSKIVENLKQPSASETNGKQPEIKEDNAKVPDVNMSDTKAAAEPVTPEIPAPDKSVKKENAPVQEIAVKIDSKTDTLKTAADESAENKISVSEAAAASEKAAATVKVVKDTPDVKVVVKSPKSVEAAKKAKEPAAVSEQTKAESKPDKKAKTETADSKNDITEDEITADLSKPEESTKKNTAETKTVKAADKSKKTEAKADAKLSAKSDAEETAETPADEIVADDSETAKGTQASSGKGGYYVQLGTYKSVKNAENLKEKISKLGFSNVTAVMVKNSSGSSVYRVRLEGYTSKNEAAQEFAKIKENFPEIKSPLISK